jgi:hypothetical protein
MLSFVKQFEMQSVFTVMKKAISVSLTILMLTAILHLSVATHYCGGRIAASKISFSGNLASCGMEDNEKELPPAGAYLVKHCCENILACYGINSVFFPSFSFVQASYQQHFQVFSVPADLNPNSIAFIKSNSINASPPGASACNSVDLSDICVLRI